MAYSGIYTPKHAEKYLGDVRKVFYRSLWERRFMKYCDDTPGVLRWSSEEIVIPYIKPTDGQSHRYFPDFYIEVQAADGGVKKFVIEVKPKAQTKAPGAHRRKTRKFWEAVANFATNQAKWAAATKYAEAHNSVFLVLTEDHLFNKGK